MRSSRRLEFAPEADDDLRSLLADSIQTWGESQQSAYAARLSDAMDKLLSYPGLGRDRGDLQPGLWSLLAGHHVIYYTADHQEVTIIRVLHERMDPVRYISPQR
jgi:toxin ParE1/3/4